MEKKKLLLLNPTEYEHEFDKKALNTLEGTPGLEKSVKYIHKQGVERYFRLGFTGSNIKVTPKNFPEIYQLLVEACENIFLKDIPDMYIEWDYRVNAMAIGSQKPMIVLFSGRYQSILPFLSSAIGNAPAAYILSMLSGRRSSLLFNGFSLINKFFVIKYI